MRINRPEVPGISGRFFYWKVQINYSFIFLVFIVFIDLPLYCEEKLQSLPLINRMDLKDDSFRQYQSDVEEGRKQLAAMDQLLEANQEKIIANLTIYRYVPREGEDLFSIAARTNIPYATLSTLNRIDHPQLLETGKDLLIPSLQGIFIPEVPEKDIEQLLAQGRQEESGLEITVRKENNAERFLFIPGSDFNPTERAFFLNIAFRYPLPMVRITSVFGLRKNPFSGRLKFHEGLDLAAPYGTEVYASRDGTVAELGFDPIYGNYVLLTHEGGWSSLYGHLSIVLTDLRKKVRSGTLLGRVGSTGQSTGPHLHFELRQNGVAKNPASLLPSKGNP